MADQRPDAVLRFAGPDLQFRNSGSGKPQVTALATPGRDVVDSEEDQ